eukprot:1150839-Pelagomonas_calceolata.AAC.1
MLIGMLTTRGTWSLRDPSSGVWQGLHKWASSEGRTISSTRLNVYSVQLLSFLRVAWQWVHGLVVSSLHGERVTDATLPLEFKWAAEQRGARARVPRIQMLVPPVLSKADHHL